MDIFVGILAIAVGSGFILAFLRKRRDGSVYASTYHYVPTENRKEAEWGAADANNVRYG